MHVYQWQAVLLGVLSLVFCQSAVIAAPSLAECNGMKDLVFVAHQDDDLLFMNPDIETTIDAGGCVRTVYLTAAERGEGVPYMLGRARGVRAAYAHMAGSANAWTEGVTVYGGKHQAQFILNQSPRISLVHMRLEDPWLGKGWGSLTPLSRTESVAGA
ncbi:MAG TPA: PIG-L family deacetylase, partial [Eoetvoesiella sp.]